MRLVPFVAALALLACKRGDPHERPPAPEPTHPTDPSIPSGSLVAPTIEVWYGILLPTTDTDVLVAQLATDARGHGVEVNPTDEPKGRWITIRKSTPEGAGYGDGHAHDQTPPTLRDLTEDQLDVKGAIVIGGGGPTAELDEIHRVVTLLAHQAAVAGGGWILDEQTKVLMSTAAFDDGVIPGPRSFVHLATFYVDEAPDGVVLTTGGMGRFGLPEVVIRLGTGVDLSAWTERVDAAGQALIDRGGLDEPGVLVAGDQRWAAAWLVDEETQTQALELTPMP